MRLRSLESKTFLALVLLATGLFLWMVGGFLQPLFWAAVFAILFRPLHERFSRRLGGRNSLAAGLTVTTVLVAVVGPVVLLAIAVTRQAAALYRRVVSGEINLQAPLERLEQHLPALRTQAARYGIEIEQLQASLEQTAVSATRMLGSQALALGQNMLGLVVLFGLMLYFLFFFLRDGERILEAIVRALPMGDARERRIFAKFADVARATIKGTLVVAVVQGFLGGVLFAIAGIEAVFFWAVAMGLLSLLPALGPALVWGPAALILLALGQVWQGVLLIVGGTLVVGLVDNLLRPILVGRDTQMPDYLVLLATLGGIGMFGLVGFVAGPVVAALFLVLWQMFVEEYGAQDQTNPPEEAGGEPPPLPA